MGDYSFFFCSLDGRGYCVPPSTFWCKDSATFIMRLVFKMPAATFLLCGAKIVGKTEKSKGKTINQRMIFPISIGEIPKPIDSQKTN